MHIYNKWVIKPKLGKFHLKKLEYLTVHSSHGGQATPELYFSFSPPHAAVTHRATRAALDDLAHPH